MADVEDPDIYAYEPIKQFETSEKGKWVLEHAEDIPVWTRKVDSHGWGWAFEITAIFKGKNVTEWLLKYGNDST